MKAAFKKVKSRISESEILNRKGVALVAILAVLILLVNIITASFSWFVPLEGKRLSYQKAFTVRNENCTFSTQVGTLWTYDTNHTQHYTDYIDYTGSASASQTVPRNGRLYFRTTVQNSDQVLYPSNISLYIADFPANLSLGVSKPSNTYRSFSREQHDLHIVRNAYVKTYVATDVDGPGKLEIDWFVVNDTSSDISLDLSGLYLVYN